MQLNRVWGLGLLLPMVAAAPQGGPPPGAPPVAPTVNNMTMFGTGCPIGGGAISQVTRNNTPVFVFREWGIVLPSEESEESGTSFKWCNEEIMLGNGPVGMRLRIASVTVGGWAQLDAGTKISLQVDTKLGGVEAGAKASVIGAEDIKDGNFEVNLVTEPTTIWSACVGPSGDVPQLTVRTTVGLVATKLEDGSFSKGVLGGNATDIERALRINFRPAWEPCPAA